MPFLHTAESINITFFNNDCLSLRSARCCPVIPAYFGKFASRARCLEKHGSMKSVRAVTSNLYNSCRQAVTSTLSQEGSVPAGQVHDFSSNNAVRVDWRSLASLLIAALDKACIQHSRHLNINKGNIYIYIL